MSQKQRLHACGYPKQSSLELFFHCDLAYLALAKPFFCARLHKGSLFIGEPNRLPKLRELLDVPAKFKNMEVINYDYRTN